MHEALIREFVREALKRHMDVSTPFTSSLFDDEKYAEQSVYVPDDIKDEIKSWTKKMMLR